MMARMRTEGARWPPEHVDSRWLIVCAALCGAPRSPSRRSAVAGGRDERRADDRGCARVARGLDDAQRKATLFAARRRGALALVERAVSSASPPRPAARRSRPRSAAARARSAARIAVEPGIPEGRGHHSPRRHQSRAAGRALAARRDGVREGASRELRLRQLLRPRFRRSAHATRAGAGSCRATISPSASRSPTARRPSCRCSSAPHRSPCEENVETGWSALAQEVDKRR